MSPDCGATVSAASSDSEEAVKALIADASEPFLVPDVTPRGASKAAVFHVLRDMVDAGALEHHADGYRRPNAAASAGPEQVPADTIEKAPLGFMCPACKQGSVRPFRCGGPHSRPGSKRLHYDFVDAVPVAALAAVRTPEEQT